jgi:hypothetical protein
VYRTVLSIAVASLVAAWLPFSIFYVTALHKQPVVLTRSGSTAHLITTGASGGRSVQTLVPGGNAVHTPALVITRAS